MQAKLFRKVKVFGLLVPVFKVKDLLAEGVLGYYSSVEKQIGIDSGLKGADLEMTVLHELFHAVLDRLHCQQQMPPEFAEVVVENLARSVIDNFKVCARK